MDTIQIKNLKEDSLKLAGVYAKAESIVEDLTKTLASVGQTKTANEILKAKLKAQEVSLNSREESVKSVESKAKRIGDLTKAETQLGRDRRTFEIYKDSETEKLSNREKSVKEEEAMILSKRQKLEGMQLALSKEKEEYKKKIEDNFFKKLSSLKR